ncbi:hypothetical protein [Ottowia sp. VDI28]|uniref:hypothetical protein n=1 Tax=Ottowia sp. VDI28 TaxID=3133968 RepID=UPI003C2CF3BB
MKAIFLTFLIAILPVSALASGAYMPPWFKVLMFLALTPEGWAIVAIVLMALIIMIYNAVRK